jgi:hypothetical protein
MENIAEYLFSRRARDLPPKALAEVLDRLVWTMDDNGKEIRQALRKWIESDDLERIRIALTCNEVFLYSTRQEMMDAFNSVCHRFPELRRACDEIIARWDRQYKTGIS